jgi:murein hydrolase activator
MALIKNIIILCCAALLLSGSVAFAQKKKAVSAKANPTHNIDKEELETQRQNILNEIKQTQIQLQSLQKDKNATYAQLKALQNKLDARQALINNINNEINMIANNINTANNDVQTLTTSLSELRKHYSELMRYSYKQRTSQDLIMFIFSSNGFYDAIRRYNYIKQYRVFRKQQAERIMATSLNLKSKILTLRQQKDQKDLRLKEQEDQKQVLSQETSQKNLVMQDLKGKEKELVLKVAEQKKVADNLNKAIAAAIRREIEIARRKAEEERKRIAAEKAENLRREKEAYAAKMKAAKDEQARMRADQERSKNLAAINKKNNAKLINGKTPTAPEGKTIASNTPNKIIESPKITETPTKKGMANPRYIGSTEPAEPSKPIAAITPTTTTYSEDLSEENRTLSNNFELNKGALNMPVSGGYICEHFGKNKHPIYNVVTENYGVDIRTNKGATVRSVFGGEISSVFYIAGAGNNILVNHGTYFTLYSKIDKAAVTKGMRVTARQSLGTVMTDADGNNQVHFEIWKVGANGALQKVNPEQWIR